VQVLENIVVPKGEFGSILGGKQNKVKAKGGAVSAG
jgi:hypothetical protein